MRNASCSCLRACLSSCSRSAARALNKGKITAEILLFSDFWPRKLPDSADVGFELESLAVKSFELLGGFEYLLLLFVLQVPRIVGQIIEDVLRRLLWVVRPLDLRSRLDGFELAPSVDEFHLSVGMACEFGFSLLPLTTCWL